MVGVEVRVQSGTDVAADALVPTEEDVPASGWSEGGCSEGGCSEGAEAAGASESTIMKPASRSHLVATRLAFTPESSLVVTPRLAFRIEWSLVVGFGPCDVSQHRGHFCLNTSKTLHVSQHRGHFSSQLVGAGSVLP